MRKLTRWIIDNPYAYLVWASLASVAGAAVAASIPAAPAISGYTVSSETAAASGAVTIVYTPTPPAPSPATVIPAAAAMPAIVQHNAGAEPRGNGIEVDSGPAYTLANASFKGFAQNIVFQNLPGLTLTNVRSFNAWREQPADIFVGQGLYLAGLTKPPTITGCIFGWNGWQGLPGQPAIDFSEYRHDVYSQFGSAPPNFTGCIFVGAPNAGVQFRNGGTCSNCIFLDCGTAVLAIQGGVTLTDCTIYGGHCYAAWGSGPGGSTVVSAWTGNVAVEAYWPINLNDVWIVGKPNQGACPTMAPGVTKCYPQGAVATGGTYTLPEWTAPPAGQLVTASGCVVAGWPVQYGTGKTFGGAIPATGAGFTVKPTSTVNYDYMPVLNAVMANQMSVANAVIKLQADIRSAVK